MSPPVARYAQWEHPPCQSDRLAVREKPASSSHVMFPALDPAPLSSIGRSMHRTSSKNDCPIASPSTLHKGKTYLGLVPFFMQKGPPTLSPQRCPGLSNFLELNVRAYVHDRATAARASGSFHSIATSRSPSSSPVGFFHLPYQHASKSAEPRKAHDLLAA